MADIVNIVGAAQAGVWRTRKGLTPGRRSGPCRKAIPIILAFHNLSAGDLADEHGQLSAQIADLETRKRAVAGELISRGLCEAEGALFRSVTVAATMVSSLDRAGIEKEMGEAWIARFLKFSKRSAFVKTTARTGAVRLAA